LIINRDELIFVKNNEEKEIKNEILLLESFDFSKNQMNINLKNHIDNIDEINKSFVWDFDADKLEFPLRLRRQDNGDWFYPMGFSGKKKVSKFFRDEKFSILARQKIWVLTDNNNSVLGIVPFRQDRRNAKDEKTKNILKIFNEK